MGVHAGRRLPEIPLVDLGAQPALDLLAAARPRAEALLATARGTYPAVMIELGDRLSRRWLEQSGNPYLHEIHGVAAALGTPGIYFLNLNYEWGCTGAVAPAPGGADIRLTRVLDWPFDGLGAALVAARSAGPAGAWINLTWPGFVGCVQGLAPGRFAAAINQAPMPRHSPFSGLDWAINRRRVWRARGLPPTHLLRRVFETASDYGAAKAALVETPIALPAIFLLCGAGPQEGCVIERLEHQAFVHEQPAAAANHWLTPGLSGTERGQESRLRQAVLAGRHGSAGADFAWLVPPVLNETTRLAMIAEPAAGRLAIQGYESDGAATRILRLEGGGADSAPGGRRQGAPSGRLNRPEKR